MKSTSRRRFVSQVAGSFAALPILHATPHLAEALTSPKGCWLTVCVPLVIEDAAKNLHTDIVLTSASFAGVDGYRDPSQSTEYELTLYDPAGKPLKIDGASDSLRLTVPAMNATLLRCRDLARGRESFWGGCRIRMLVNSKAPFYVSDLFSAAFVRWNYASSFDTLHAHPDPPQMQTTDTYYASMPYPDLADYDCTLSLFNPYAAVSEGRITLYAENGSKRFEQPYKLTPFASSLLKLNEKQAAAKQLSRVALVGGKNASQVGSVLVANQEKSVKTFSYLMIKGKNDNAFAAEHTIHLGNYPVTRGYAPFDDRQAFKPRGWVFSSFIFKKAILGGLEMSSRVYFSSGRPLEDELWLLAYANDADGNLQWATSHDNELGMWLPANFLQRGAIRLQPFQSCSFDFDNLAIQSGFAGGIGVAASPATSHVLMKVEVKVHNWGTAAFSHFRPGVKSGYRLKDIAARGGLATDYVVTGANVKRTGGAPQADSLIATYNLEEGKAGAPTLEVFGKQGFISRKKLEPLPASACRHYLLSALFPELAEQGAGPLTLRLIDEQAVITLGALHIDYQRRDVALDHGSDRFSTHLDFNCD